MDTLLLGDLGNVERKDATNRDWDALDQVNAYEVLRTATELFLMTECGLVPLAASINYEDRLAKTGPEQLNVPLLARIRTQFNADTVELKANYLTKLANSAQSKVLPYYGLIIERLEDLPPKPELVAKDAYDYGILREAATRPPMVELIWSYWHEQGMLIQTMAAIVIRFQPPGGCEEPLANLNIDPLRGANNLGSPGMIVGEVTRARVRVGVSSDRPQVR